MEREILASIGDNKYKVDLGSMTKNVSFKLEKFVF